MRLVLKANLLAKRFEYKCQPSEGDKGSCCGVYLDMEGGGMSLVETGQIENINKLIERDAFIDSVRTEVQY